MDYESHRAKYIKKGRGVNFREAVKQMDDFIRDPIVRKYFACIQFDVLMIALFHFRHLLQMLW